MIIKHKDFELHVRRYNKTAHVKIKNFTGKRGQYAVKHGNFTFQSSSYPAYGEDDGNIFFLVGSDAHLDNNVVKVPYSLVQRIKEWFENGSNEPYRPDVTKDFLRREMESYYYIESRSGAAYPTYCKESACYYIDRLNRENHDCYVNLGIKLSKARLKALKLLLVNTPPEAKIKFGEKKFTYMILPKWWQGFYRVGWLLVAIRKVTNKRTDEHYNTAFLNEKFNLFIKGNFTLTEHAKRLWASQSMNWINHSRNRCENAFKTVENL